MRTAEPQVGESILPSQCAPTSPNKNQLRGNCLGSDRGRDENMDSEATVKRPYCAGRAEGGSGWLCLPHRQV